MTQITLRPYQNDLVQRVRNNLARYKWVLMQSATGSGKTVMGAKMIQMALAKGSRSIFLVPRRELLNQTAITFQNFNIPFGIISAGYTPNPFAKVQIATAGSLARRLDSVQAPHLIFPDECHFGKGEQDRIIKWAKSHGSYGIGLSATPEKTCGTGLGMWFNHMELGPEIRELIELGNLSDYRAFAPSTPDMSGVKTVKGDYSQSAVSSMMEQDSVLIGNAVSHYKQHAMGKLNIGFCTSIKHSELSAQAYRDEGIPAAAIHGKMSDTERMQIIKAFARRELKVLTNNNLLTFGFDLAAAADMDVTVEALSIMRPTKSLPLHMQMIGRALRPKDEPALLFDHAGNFERHGLPDDEHPWTLDDREKKGRGDSEPTMPTRQCPKCYFVAKPSPVCPNCGHVHEITDREIKQIEGDLEEIKVVQRKKEARMEQGQARTYPELVALGVSKGYKNADAWAKNVLKGRRR